ncbi:uncharacterized protein BDZ99DRAFT_270075 [Mytilinidion resinicola]|uniref:Uncharacterized protein n=1 Tax=Mytilinidion resinicola TaxID=574789 RepID=A0A6A6YUH3_9PEZI|nr:uncharacterized protein BDZ99DRAFT_270075 [Mytilinidion resinicola]KAF2812606.1 hypothetical protein BDZ99DRAFT_270075 [Mytilinidion resinicola]
MRQQAQYENTLLLGDLINFLPGRFASVPQDYFFGLLGMAADSDRDEFRPDYKSPARKVILRTGRFLLSQKDEPELLSRAGLGELQDLFPRYGLSPINISRAYQITKQLVPANSRLGLIRTTKRS